MRPQRQLADPGPDLVHQRGDTPRRGGADGVSDGQPIGPETDCGVDDVEDALGRCRSVERAVHAVAMMTSTRAPASWAIATISAICAVASALLRPTLAWECASAADTTYSSERSPAAIARLAPLGLATRAENSMSG